MSNIATRAMDTSARYSALEHGGLEVTERPDAPEVVPGSSPPIERRSSLNMPETVHPGQYEMNRDEHGNYYGDGKTDAAAPEYGDEARPAYMSNDAKGGSGVAVQESQAPPKPKRYCGMRRGVLIALIIVAIVVVIGAVVGGVLGALLPKHHKS